MTIDIETPSRDEDETMAENAEKLAEAIIGQRIASAENGTALVKSEWREEPYEEYGFIITLDDGKRVMLQGGDDCCAFTYLESFLLHPDKVDHIITGVGTEDGYQKWHIYADLGDILELNVDWSPGNFPYYGYGLTITVIPVEDE